MDNGNGIQPVMNVGGYGYGGDGFGMGGWGGIIGLLAVLGLANGGFGFGGNRNYGGNSDAALIAAMSAANNNGFANAIGYENLATSNEVQRGFDNQNAMANQREILSAVTSGTAQAVAATNSTFHDTLAVLNDKYSEIQRDIAANAVTLANLQGHQSECCCDILRATDGINYNGAINTAAINANTTAVGQKILDAISANRMADMQNQINQLQLAQATNGMLRFPNSWTYGAGFFPPVFGGCCGNGFGNGNI